MHRQSGIRLGGPVIANRFEPEAWILELQRLGYRAAYCPLEPFESREISRAFMQAAEMSDIIIAEVGIWNNPLAADPAERKKAVDECVAKLAFADEIGARCCVNISGSRSSRWDGPHPDNYSPETYDKIIETTRLIIDSVKPKRTFYTLEPMPWMLPDSPHAYLKLLRAIQRPQFGVHLDPVNMITSPALYYNTAAFINMCFDVLGPHIKSCHAKDIVLEERYTFHVNEARPGLGVLDYKTLIRRLADLGQEIPLMLEHLPSETEYVLAAEHIRRVAAKIAVTV